MMGMLSQALLSTLGLSRCPEGAGRLCHFCGVPQGTPWSLAQGSLSAGWAQKLHLPQKERGHCYLCASAVNPSARALLLGF